MAGLAAARARGRAGGRPRLMTRAKLRTAMTMMADQESSLAHHFGDLTDPRIDRSRLHELLDIVAIAICAVIAGADDFVSIALWARQKRDWLSTPESPAWERDFPVAPSYSEKILVRGFFVLRLACWACHLSHSGAWDCSDSSDLEAG